MWKGKPMVASAVGGIQDQITDGQDGLLVRDPADLDAFASALRRLVTGTELAHLLARAAHERVLGELLDDRYLVQSPGLLRAMAANGG
jgi:trehalose synthase